MELHLRNLANRQSTTWHGLHTMSDHGLKVALFAPCIDGWRLYALASSPTLKLNDEVVTGGRVLQPGDRIFLGDRAFFVESLRITSVEEASELPAPLCRITTPTTAVDTESELLIGSSNRCGLQLPAEPGIEPTHALLAPVGERWFLHPLSRAGVGRFQGDRPLSVPVEDGTRVKFGNLELVFEFPGDDLIEIPEDTQTAEPSGKGDTLFQGSSVIPTNMGLPRDPLHEKTMLLVGQVVQGKVCPPTRSVGGGMFGFLRTRSPEDTLEHLRSQLTDKPESFSLLFALVKFLQQQDYLDLCRKVLYRMRQLNPHEIEVSHSLAVLCSAQGQDESRPVERRIKDYEKAARFVQEVLHRRPDEAMRQLQDRIETELTVLRGGLDKLQPGEWS